MAETTSYQRGHYPLMAYNFRVIIDGTSMSFSEVSGLHREHQTLTYRHGLSFLEGEEIVKFRHDKYVPITLRRGTVPGMGFLYAWLEEKDKRSLEVSLCDERGEPVLSWHVAKAIPVKLEAPSFTASGDDVSIESLEVMAAGISIRDRS